MTGRERGEISLASVLVACVLMLVILGATLSVFEGFIARASDATLRTSAEDAARTAADRVARDLRNLASPTADLATPTVVLPPALDVATGTDLIFLTVDPAGPNAGTNKTNTKRVRYCLDAPGRLLYEQTQTWTSSPLPPPVPSSAGCPATGWTRTAVAAADIVNDSLPVFSYNASAQTDISAVHLDLLVDTDVVRKPVATRLSTGVFLRNQNRRPTAMFTATRTAGGFVLNASASVDPEGDALDYAWYDGTTLKGTGITYTYTGLAAGVHQLRVEVTDSAGLTTVSATQAVTA